MSELYRGVLMPNRIQRDRDEKGPYSALFAAWREGVDAALETAAETVVRETRNATGAPGVSEVWDLFNQHAAKLADHLRGHACAHCGQPIEPTGGHDWIGPIPEPGEPQKRYHLSTDFPDCRRASGAWTKDGES
jgi:hypothetical protein